MLAIEGLTKKYPGDIKALQGVEMTSDGGIYGLLGPNGAGKSTLMRILATLLPADAGSVQLNGVDIFKNPHESRQKIGYLPQELGVYPRVSAIEVLNYFAGLKGLRGNARRFEVESKLELVNLADVANQRLDTFSGGMKRRFGIANAFLGQPELVIVDEPTAGLDPYERRRFQLLLAKAAQNCMIILSSHIVEDLAGLCQRMAVLDRGQILAEGAPQQLVDDLSQKIWAKQISFQELDSAKQSLDLLSWRPHQGGVLVKVRSAEKPAADFLEVEPDLEDLYTYHLGGQV